MNVLGLSFSDHEAAAALVIGGRLSSAIARERLTRIKRDGIKWGGHRLDLTAAIQYCLDSKGLVLADIDLIVWNHTEHLLASEVYSLLSGEGALDLSTRPLLPLPHHFAHACCAYYLSPFKDAAVLVVDGAGGPFGGLMKNCAGPEPEAIDRGAVVVQNLSLYKGDGSKEHESFYLFDGGQWTVLRKIIGDWCGIGAVYGSASKLIFGDYLDAGKIMGLAPYGDAHSENMFLAEAGTDELTTFTSMRSTKRSALEAQITRWQQQKEPLSYEIPLLTDFAASLQKETEGALLSYARWLRNHSGNTRLCFSGGVALNCVANTRIAAEAGFSEVFVPPYPGDDGLAVGCALYGAAINGAIKPITNPAFLGRVYAHETEALEGLGLKRCFDIPDVFERVAKEIANGAVVAWYEGGAEMGPRALGHRSFLADPRRPEMKERLNSEIKNRESFRPFAPVVLHDAVSDYFVEVNPSYFMSFVARVRDEKRDAIPAVTHIDGSARYQVLREEDNPNLFRLITSFQRLTGIPILLNTSFNRAGEPLIETPLEAGRCVIASSADYLVVDKFLYRNAASSK